MVYDLEEFINDIFRIAKRKGYQIETSRVNGLPQIVFGHKKLHLDHIKKLFPDVLFKNSNINKLIENVASGRPCTHKPFREIIGYIKEEKGDELSFIYE